MKPDNFARISHILDSIGKIEEVFSEMDFEEFIQDWRNRDAVIRNFEIIGEAANRVDENLKAKYPQVEWMPAITMRNFLIHEYFEVDMQAVWKTIKNDLPTFKLYMLEILKDLEN